MSVDACNHNHIDLRGTPCPINFVRCRLALESLFPQDILIVQIDKGEPELMVIPGLRKSGHKVYVIHEEPTWVRLKVICGAKRFA